MNHDRAASEPPASELGTTAMPWWQTFFDADYVKIWGDAGSLAADEAQADGMWQLLSLRPGARVLDAPCGYGRLSGLLAQRGAQVLGVDQSRALLDEAERRRGTLTRAQLRYAQHDLRTPLPALMADSGFDVALNLYTSLGYGSEADDLAMLTTLRRALRRAGLLFVETLHREAALASMSAKLVSHRAPDGTIVTEEPRYDASTQRVDTRWSWSGPAGSGRKTSSVRLYTPTELIDLLSRAGLDFRSAHHGCTGQSFVADGRRASPRIGIVSSVRSM